MATTEQPLVSIVVPTFNRLPYLREALQSVFAQGWPHWELLLADDGSDPDTRAYLQGLQQASRVRVLSLPHSGNPPRVRNQALRYARGEFVAFLDSDDVWLPNKLERQLQSLRDRPHCQWSYCAFRMVDAQLKPLHRSINFIAEGGWIAPALMNLTTTIVQSSVVMRRDFLHQVGPYDERLPICGDYELWARCALKSAADCVGEPLLLVRRHAAHYCDDVAACRDFTRALDLIRPYTTDTALRSILHRQRAIAAATLARSQAVSRRPLDAWATLLATAPRSWRHKQWWPLALAAVTRTLLPPLLPSALRRLWQREHRC